MPYFIAGTSTSNDWAELYAPSDEYDQKVMLGVDQSEVPHEHGLCYATHSFRPVDPARMAPFLCPIFDQYSTRPEGLQPLPDWMGTNGAGYVTVVSDRFRQAIEDLEPNVHQFIPIEIRRREDGAVYEGQYFYLIFQQHAFTVDAERSDAITIKQDQPDDPVIYSKNSRVHRGIPDIVLRADRVGDMHLWREFHSNKGIEVISEKIVWSGGTAVSDALMARMKADGLTGWQISGICILDTELDPSSGPSGFAGTTDI